MGLSTCHLKLFSWKVAKRVKPFYVKKDQQRFQLTDGRRATTFWLDISLLTCRVLWLEKKHIVSVWQVPFYNVLMLENMCPFTSSKTELWVFSHAFFLRRVGRCSFRKTVALAFFGLEYLVTQIYWVYNFRAAVLDRKKYFSITNKCDLEGFLLRKVYIVRAQHMGNLFWPCTINWVEKKPKSTCTLYL